MNDRLGPWRAALGAALAFGLGLPLAALAAELAAAPAAWRAWAEFPRLARLAATTVLLAAAVVALALPAGVTAAVLLYRTDLPGRRPWRAILVPTLFVPLPLAATAWQAALGGGVLAVTDPAGWRPWAGGFARAVLVHAAVALPWVAWLAGLGLSAVERDVEEDALTASGPWRVLFAVTLPRAAPALAAAGLWAALSAAGEITVTDVFQVRTFSEEVYTQFVAPEPDGTSGGRDAVARAVAVALPQAAVAAGLVLAALAWWGGRLPPVPAWPRPTPLVALGAWRWPAFLVVAAGVAGLVGVPVGSLVAQAGQEGTAWSFVAAGRRVARAAWLHGGLVAGSAAVAAAAGVAASALALAACWLSAGAPRMRAALFAAGAVAWALPGPVVGIALKAAIDRLLSLEEAAGLAHGPLRAWLYDGPSPVPVWWACVLRYTPVAAAVLWPVVRLTPAGLRDAARADGATPPAELRHVVLPGAWPAAVLAALVVAALSLGELSAGKLVETPGGQTFAHEVFAQMHYGVTADLAALCLVQLLLGGAAAGLVLAAGRGRA